MNKNNNLFTYATGELSQDAFLCWLFSYLMKDADEEPTLKTCATDFIKQFIPEILDEQDIWLSEAPKKQYKSIDVLLTVNDKYKIIIEDKTYTSEHDDQLNRYLEIVRKDFKDYIPIGIYFKIGFQSNLNNVIKNGYKPYGREKILETLERYVNKTNNLIFKSYYETIKSFDDEVKKYKFLPVSEWNWAQINGFYNDIKFEIEQEKNMYCNYGYVANQTGGFYGMWISNDTIRMYDGKKYELYLQCEFSNGFLDICYKASSKDGDKIDRSAREYFVWREEGQWVNIAEKNGFIRPTRYGCGKTVTLGFFDSNQSSLNFISLKKIIYKAIDAFENVVRELKV